MRPTGTAAALVAIAVGAVLTYALHFTVSGVNIRTVGVIIMLAGAVGLVLVLSRSLMALRRPERQRRTRAGTGLDEPNRGYAEPPQAVAPAGIALNVAVAEPGRGDRSYSTSPYQQPGVDRP